MIKSTNSAANSSIPRRTWLIWSLVILGNLIVAIVCWSVFSGSLGSLIDSARVSKRHVFSLDSTEQYLSEDKALELARRTLVLEGYNVNEWQPRAEGQGNGTHRDEEGSMLTRGSDSKSGRIQFVNEKEFGENRRFVEVELSDNRVTTYIWMPK